ncbi:hypothetical protein KFL_004100035 [Klebsormidium nitens]|uniref:Uncharacterized protein n=1 Tax=Klebsormidium nitens TaxID=105231 RepID=A0A1Y1IB74_KLENI|nr:hypothetical protein KFL_004100035 [Klebsormidium nitens]|eukprot:GAQ88215.1 hypothetical protein KFL_004100035 [Klebsormidium nitens]
MGSSEPPLFLRQQLEKLLPPAEKLGASLKVEGVSCTSSDHSRNWRNTMLRQYLYSVVDDILRDVVNGGFGAAIVDPASGKLLAAEAIFKDVDTLSLESLVAALYRALKDFLRETESLDEKFSWLGTFGVTRCQMLGQSGLLAAIDYFLSRAKKEPALCRAFLARLDKSFADPTKRYCAISVRALARACLKHLLGAADDTAQAPDDVFGQVNAALPTEAGVGNLEEAGWYAPLDEGTWIENYFQVPAPDVQSGATQTLHQPAVMPQAATTPLQGDQRLPVYDLARDLVSNGHASLVLESFGPVAMEMVEGENAVERVQEFEAQAAPSALNEAGGRSFGGLESLSWYCQAASQT